MRKIKWIISTIFLIPAICYIAIVNLITIPMLFILGIPSFIFKDSYAGNMLLGIDQLYNTLFGGNEDVTISSRLGSNYSHSVLSKLVNFLAFDKDHCKNAIEEDEDNIGIIK